MRSVIPWSWTTIQSYETCPRQFYELKIAKNFKEDFTGEHIVWGNAVHKALEDRVKYSKPLPERMANFEPMAAKLAAAPGDKYPEIEIALKEDLTPTGYWDDDCWTRGKDDLVIVRHKIAIDIDYKTGKPDTNTQQLELAAARVMAMWPEVEIVKTAYAWLKTGTWTRAEYRRTDLNKIWDGFRERLNDVLWSQQNNAWPAKPSGLCRKSKKPGSTYMGCIVATCPHSEYYRGNK